MGISGNKNKHDDSNNYNNKKKIHNLLIITIFFLFVGVHFLSHKLTTLTELSTFNLLKLLNRITHFILSNSINTNNHNLEAQVSKLTPLEVKRGEKNKHRRFSL